MRVALPASVTRSMLCRSSPNISLSLYIYIYIERERDVYIYIYIYVYICSSKSLSSVTCYGFRKSLHILRKTHDLVPAIHDRVKGKPRCLSLYLHTSPMHTLYYPSTLFACEAAHISPSMHTN